MKFFARGRKDKKAALPKLLKNMLHCTNLLWASGATLSNIYQGDKPSGPRTGPKLFFWQSRLSNFPYPTLFPADLRSTKKILNFFSALCSLEKLINTSHFNGNLVAQLDIGNFLFFVTAQPGCSRLLTLVSNRTAWRYFQT